MRRPGSGRLPLPVKFLLEQAGWGKAISGWVFLRVIEVPYARGALKPRAREQRCLVLERNYPASGVDYFAQMAHLLPRYSSAQAWLSRAQPGGRVAEWQAARQPVGL